MKVFHDALAWQHRVRRWAPFVNRDLSLDAYVVRCRVICASLMVVFLVVDCAWLLSIVHRLVQR